MTKEAWCDFKNWDYQEFEDNGKKIPEYGFAVRSFAQAIPLGEWLWNAGIIGRLVPAINDTKHIKRGSSYVCVVGKEDIQKLRVLLKVDPKPLSQKPVRGGR